MRAQLWVRVLSSPSLDKAEAVALHPVLERHLMRCFMRSPSVEVQERTCLFQSVIKLCARELERGNSGKVQVSLHELTRFGAISDACAAHRALQAGAQPGCGERPEQGARSQRPRPQPVSVRARLAVAP
jgi:hypothetical protein